MRKAVVGWANPRASDPAPAQAPHPPWCSGGCCNPEPSSAVKAGEPVRLQHMAVAEDGVLRWSAGRKIANCELYAMPDFGTAPLLYRSAQSEPRAPVLTAEAIMEWCGNSRILHRLDNGKPEQWLDVSVDRLNHAIKALAASTTQPPATKGME